MDRLEDVFPNASPEDLKAARLSVEFLGILSAGMSKHERTKFIVDEINKQWPVEETDADRDF